MPEPYPSKMLRAAVKLSKLSWASKAFMEGFEKEQTKGKKKQEKKLRKQLKKAGRA